MKNYKTITLFALLFGILFAGSCAVTPNEEQSLMVTTDNKIILPRSDLHTVTIRIVELDGHKYVIADSYVGGAGDLSIIHAESCDCKQKNNNY